MGNKMTVLVDICLDRANSKGLLLMGYGCFWGGEDSYCKSDEVLPCNLSGVFCRPATGAKALLVSNPAPQPRGRWTNPTIRSKVKT